MLTKTFQHLPGIGHRTEKRLWSEGIDDWSAFMQQSVTGISSVRKLALNTMLKNDLEALKHQNFSRFHTWPLRLHYRSIPHLERVLYLDIETYGIKDSRVTIIALSDAENVRILYGPHIDRSVLEQVFSWAQAIVTFNGSRFDIPYLFKTYRITMNSFHIDLEPLARARGLIGGLKAIEPLIGIERQTHLMSGEPLDLWKRYLASGDDYYLDMLVSYAEQDVLSLATLLEHVI